MSRKTRNESPVGQIPSRQVQRQGNPRRAAQHEGPAGVAGRPEVKTKWGGPTAGRDNPEREIEPGKSRGVNG